MNEIKITKQSEWDELPSAFEELTHIKIMSGDFVINSTPKNSKVSLYNNSSARLWGKSSARLWGKSSAELCNNSSAELCNNSSARLYDNSSAALFEESMVRNFSRRSKIKGYEDSIIKLHVDTCDFELFDNCELVGNCQADVQFSEWIDRGYVVADGIYLKLITQKTLGNVSIYKGEKFDGETLFVAKRGDKTAHGEDVESAIENLRYKISDRDTSKYDDWTLDTTRSTDEMIQAYMTITGACPPGTKMFCENKKLKDEYSVKEVIELTEGNFGNKEFKTFFK